VLAPLALVLATAAGLPPTADGAPDRAVAEVESSDALAVHGSTLAWIEYDETVVGGVRGQLTRGDRRRPAHVGGPGDRRAPDPGGSIS